MRIVEYIQDKEKLTLLLNDKDTLVRSEIAQYGTDAQRQALIHDKEIMVLINIFQYGNWKQRYALLENEDSDLRQEMVRIIFSEMKQDAENKKICSSEIENHRNNIIKILSTDKDERVRSKIAEYGNDEHRQNLINDKSMMVIAQIVEYGNDAQREYIMNNYE